MTRLHGITHALVYGSQRMEDYTKQHKCMFDKYISQNIKLYHDKTYQYHIKRSKYIMKFSREFVRKSDDYNSRKNKMSKYLFKVLNTHIPQVTVKLRNDSFNFLGIYV